MKQRTFLTVLGNYTVFAILLMFISSCDKYEKRVKESTSVFAKRQNNRLSKISDSALISMVFEDSAFMKDKENIAFAGKYKALMKGKLSEPIKNEILARFYIDHFKHTEIPLQRQVEGRTEYVAITESSWIDAATIIALAGELMDNPDLLDGIRVYNARYPTSAIPIDSDMDPQFAERQAIIFVATARREESGQVYHEDYYTTPSQTTGTALYIYDYNSLCPPQEKCRGALLGGY